MIMVNNDWIICTKHNFWIFFLTKKKKKKKLGEDRTRDEDVTHVTISPAETTANSGESIRLTCSAHLSGERSAPTISWSKSDAGLPVNAQQNAGILVIPNASPADSGIYVCTVTTSYGITETSQARVNVLAYRYNYNKSNNWNQLTKLHWIVFKMCYNFTRLLYFFYCFNTFRTSFNRCVIKLNNNELNEK